MKTCETCKWWTPPGEDWEVCSNPKTMWIQILGECSRATKDVSCSGGYYHNDPKEIPLNEAFAVSSDTHGLAFLTGPKFGCIHHELK